MHLAVEVAGLTLHMQRLDSQDLRVEVWLVALDQLLDSATEGGLSADERRRADAFVKPIDAQRYRLAHGALRERLASETGSSAQNLVFTTGVFGKPVLLHAPGVHFSISHSGPIGLIAISRHAAVGVDAEWPAPISEIEALAQQVLAPDERRAWLALTPQEHQSAFLRAWTRKEACLKAWGVGLQLSPSQLEVGLHTQRQRIHAPPILRAQPVELWSLSIADNPGIQAAVALGSAV